MSYTNDLDLEIQSSGQADWDTGLNANFSILETGLTFKSLAGGAINSGDIVAMTSSSYIVKYDPRSADVGPPAGWCRQSASSGANVFVTHLGIARSLGVGSLVTGQPVYASNNASSLGLYVASYETCQHPVGLALNRNAMLIRPRPFDHQSFTLTNTFLALGIGTGSAANFTLAVGNRGMLTRLEVVVGSHASINYKIQLWSGSSRVSSELLYETLTTSKTVSASADVASNYYLDGAGFPYKVTETASGFHIYGRLTIQSGHNTNSQYFGVTVETQRFK